MEIIKFAIQLLNIVISVCWFADLYCELEFGRILTFINKLKLIVMLIISGLMLLMNIIIFAELIWLY